MLTDMHSPQAEVNFCDQCANALKPAIIQDYYRCMGYVDKNDCITDGYSIHRCVWKVMKKFFHLLDLSILNSFILSTFSSSKIISLKF
jgi:hypothetical protein